NEAALADILNMDQVARLRQIALQLRGPLALCEPDIAATLKLTTVQRERIRGIGMDIFFFFKDEPRKDGKDLGKEFGKDGGKDFRKDSGKDDWRKPFKEFGRDGFGKGLFGKDPFGKGKEN